MSIDRQRIDAVKLLQEQGYTYSLPDGWKAKPITLEIKPLPKDCTQIFCEECGSVDVYRDGTIGWNVQKQDWTEIGAVYDNGGCTHCGDGCIGEADADQFTNCAACGHEFHEEFLGPSSVCKRCVAIHTMKQKGKP